MRTHPLVYLISQPSHQSSLILEALKGKKFTVHCFDDISLTLPTISEDTRPDIVVYHRPMPVATAWNNFNALRMIARPGNRDLPAVIVLDVLVSPDLLSRVTGLPTHSFMRMPVKPADVADRVESMLTDRYPMPLRRIILLDDEAVLTEDQAAALNHYGFQLIASSHDKIRSDTGSAHHEFILMTCRNRTRGLAERIRRIDASLDHPIIVLMPESTGSVDLRELPMYCIAAVLPGDVSPPDLVTAMDRVMTGGLIQNFIVKMVLENREIASREALYRRVVDHQEDLLCKWRPDTTLTFVNQAFCNRTGQSRRTLIGRSLRDWVPQEYHPQLEAIGNQLFRGGRVETYEHPFIDASGETRWYQWTSQPIFDAEGIVVEVLSDGRDMTDRRRLEIDLQQKSEEQELLLENMSSQVWFLQTDGRYGRVNRAHAEFLGRSADSVAGLMLEEVFPEADAAGLKKITDRAVSSRITVSDELMLTMGTGERRLLDLTITPRLDARGQVLLLVCCAQDITRQRMMEFSLAFRAEFEHLISEISSTFVQYVPEKLDIAIKDSLERIGVFTGADRVFLMRCTEPDARTTKHYEWHSETSDSPVLTSCRLPEQLCRRLVNMEKIHIQNVQEARDRDNPPEAADAYFIESGICSALYLPVKEQGQLFGVIGMESVTELKTWDDETQFLLRFYGELLLHTLQKKQTAEIIRVERDLGIQLSTAASLETALELCLEHAIRIAGMDCGGIYLIDEATQNLELVKYRGLSDEFVRLNSHFNRESRQYKRLQAGGSIYFSYEDPVIQSEHIRFENIRAIGVVPIRYGNDIIACMNVGSHTKTAVPRQARIALEALISRLGPAIAKARVEDRVRRNWENLDNLLNSIEDFLFVFEPGGRILHTNVAVTTALGYESDRLTELSIDALFQKDPFGENDEDALAVLKA
nr:PAS domain-containing protein [bacterium]